MNHPRDVLLGVQAGGMALPVCDHYSGVEQRMKKSLQLQAEMTEEFGACVFDVTLDCEDGAPVGGEADHAAMVVELALATAPAARVAVRVHPVDHPAFEADMALIAGRAGHRLCHIMIPKVESVDDVRRMQVKDPDFLAFVTQTTLSMDDTAEVIDALRQRFPKIVGPKKEDICYATQNRQDAVKRLAAECDLVLVVGSPNSSNSNRLRELAEKHGVSAHLIDGAADIEADWLTGRSSIGLTAGASAPESLVQGVVTRLAELGVERMRELDGEQESVIFALPKDLRLILVD